MKLSIIVPAYNVGNCITGCLESLRNQDFEDYEVIVVNDGSQDNTFKVVEDYVAKTKLENFHLFSQSNGGVSSARNLGIDKAKGDYLMFVDADDTIEPDSLSKIASYLDNSSFIPDLVLFGIHISSIGGTESDLISFDYQEITNVPEFLTEFKQNDLAFGGPWGKLYRREVVVTNHLKYDKTYRRHEDMLFTLQFAPHCKRIATLPVMVYNYNHNIAGATMQFFGEDAIRMHDGIRQALIEYFVDFCNNPEYLAMINRKYAFDYLFSIYALYRKPHLKKRLHWTQKYWEAAERVYSNFSIEFDTGVPRIAGCLGRKSKCILHLFLSSIFGLERIKSQIEQK